MTTAQQTTLAAYDQAREHYEAADDAWIAKPPYWRNDPGKRAAYRTSMATLAAACRDAAATEYDRAFWDLRVHHFQSAGAAPLAKPRPARSEPHQLNLFDEVATGATDEP